jgi:secondary thiamine-phosphate synthase enzyme
MSSGWFQKQIVMPYRARGSYLITEEILAALPQIRSYKIGLLHLFVQHTSCALSLNENWDPDVRKDMTNALERIVPSEGENGEQLYRHCAEGPDDMPAHIKSALIGASITIPIKDGKLVCTLGWGIVTTRSGCWEERCEVDVEEYRLTCEPQATGTWQGIWYLEFRTEVHQRKITATIQGEKIS